MREDRGAAGPNASGASQLRAGHDGSRARVLAAVHSAEGALPVAEIARLVCLHTATVRTHLDALAAQGLIEAIAERRHTPGRPRTLYRSTVRARLARSPEDDLRRMTAILAAVSAHDTRPDAWEDARAWGAQWRGRCHDDLPDQQRVVDALVSGGAAAWSVGDCVVAVAQCPFAEVARGRADMVCAIHAEAIRSVVSGPGQVSVTRGIGDAGVSCVVHLDRGEAPRDGFADP